MAESEKILHEVPGHEKKVADAPRPHYRSCKGCREEHKCFNCGEPAVPFVRCTSGACPKCCGPRCAHYPRGLA